MITFPQQTILFNDNGTHTIDAESPDIDLDNTTTLNVVVGAVIAGAPGVMTFRTGETILFRDATYAAHAVLARSGTTVTISGGQLLGGDSLYQGARFADGGAGLYLYFGNATITGGEFRGGSANWGGPGLWQVTSGGNATGQLTISGGAFTGGDGLSAAGPAVRIMGNATISGGTFTGGTDQGGGVVSPGPSLHYMGVPGASLTITGGVFQGEFNLIMGGGLYPGAMTIQGSGLSFSNGRITGTLESGDPIDVAVQGPNPATPITVTSTEIRFNY